MVMKVELDVLLEYYTTTSCKEGVETRVRTAAAASVVVRLRAT